MITKFIDHVENLQAQNLVAKSSRMPEIGMHEVDELRAKAAHAEVRLARTTN